MFGDAKGLNARSRAAAAGEIRVQLRGQTTFVRSAAMIWNQIPALRSARTSEEAKKIARRFARTLPV